MSGIHGIIYIIVGLTISIYSWFLDRKKFFVFIILGGMFVLVGLGKWIFNKNRNPRQKKHTANQYKHPIQSFEQNIAAYCHSCGNAIRHFDNFCSRCGQRMLRKK